jgi:cytochrome c556
MARKVLIAAAVALTALASGSADAPSVKDIMKKANSPTGIFFNLGTDLKDDNPNWKDVQQEAKDLAMLASALRLTTPPRGDKDSWDKLTKAYADTAKVLEQATAKKDQDAARAAWGKINDQACKACHAAHRPPE